MIAAGDAHVAIELTVDGDLAKRGATLDVEDLRGWSTHDDCHSVGIVSNLASPTVIERKMPDTEQNPLLSREQREVRTKMACLEPHGGRGGSPGGGRFTMRRVVHRGGEGVHRGEDGGVQGEGGHRGGRGGSPGGRGFGGEEGRGEGGRGCFTREEGGGVSPGERGGCVTRGGGGRVFHPGRRGGGCFTRGEGGGGGVFHPGRGGGGGVFTRGGREGVSPGERGGCFTRGRGGGGGEGGFTGEEGGGHPRGGGGSPPGGRGWFTERMLLRPNVTKASDFCHLGQCYLGQCHLGQKKSTKTQMSLRPVFRRLNFWGTGE